MKVIPLSEAKTNLSHYGNVCHDEPVIVTVNGVPKFQIVSLEEGDDLIDRLLEYNPKFRQRLADRLKSIRFPSRPRANDCSHFARLYSSSISSRSRDSTPG